MVIDVREERTRSWVVGSERVGLYATGYELHQLLLRLVFLFAAIAALVLIGSVGFSLLEHQSLWQGFLQTMDIVATVGALEPPSTTGGQVLKIALITLGVGTMFYALITVTEFVVAGHFTGLLYSRKMERKIAALRDHFIVCGFGRVGRQVVRDLKAAGVPLVAIDVASDLQELFEQLGVPYLTGSASDEHVLQQAGIMSARALVACTGSDAENIYITLTVRELRPDIEIVARANYKDVFSKLEKAGANRVVSPYMTSGQAMAKLALQPHVSEYLDVVTGSDDFRMEEIEILEACPVSGKELGQLEPAARALIVALRRGPERGFELKPDPSTVLEPGNVLIAMGNPKDLERLEGICAPDGPTDGPGSGSTDRS